MNDNIKPLSLELRLNYIDTVDEALRIELGKLEGMPFGWVDLFMFGAVKRAMCLISGFRTMIEARNFTCAAPMVRMQLDTALRISALGLVDDPEAFADSVMQGAAINKFKDTNGARLTDRHLVNCIKDHRPWVEGVYNDSSDFIHFSGRHLYTSMHSLEDAGHDFHLYIGSQDPPSVKEEAYYEAVDAFWECSRLILGYVREFVSVQTAPDEPA